MGLPGQMRTSYCRISRLPSCRAHPSQDARQAPSPTAQTPCRQGLRLPSPPSGPALAPNHPLHRPHDHHRGWLAIDPKGVVGEVEYEIGASLRNPYENPELFTSPQIVERRIKCYEAKLELDPERLLGWGFAQAVLSAIWSVEDGFAVDASSPSIMLAKAIRPMLE